MTDGRVEVEELTVDECLELLRAHQVGRLAVVTPAGPAIFPVNYAIGVDLTVADPAGSGTPAMHVAITGLVAAKTSAELSRKVLSTGQVRHCQITHLSPA